MKREPVFEAYSDSITCFNKEKNGDHLLLKDIEAEKILLAVVADGVSNQPCDWLASELVCSEFHECFLEYTYLSIIDRIRKSISSETSICYQ